MSEFPRTRPSANAHFDGPLRFQPGPADIQAVIERALGHPLGLEFLVDGELNSVAATFQAHAFTVLAAREYLITNGH